MSGKRVDPFNMKADDIDIQDISHSLSMQCRYNGHLGRFYSVAEHCVLVSQLVPAEQKLWGLLHDATEAYVGDLISPIKRKMDDFVLLEDEIHGAVSQHFGLTSYIPDLVHNADKYIQELECEWINAGCPNGMHGIVGLDPSAAATLFMNTFNALVCDEEYPKMVAA